MHDIKKKEVWFVDYPYEDNPDLSKVRPVVVLDVIEDNLEVLSVKVTSKPPRTDNDVLDFYEVPLFDWQKANLSKPSVARISKITLVQRDAFLERIGIVSEKDWNNIKKKARQFFKELSPENEEENDRGR